MKNALFGRVMKELKKKGDPKAVGAMLDEALNKSKREDCRDVMYMFSAWFRQIMVRVPVIRLHGAPPS